MYPQRHFLAAQIQVEPIGVCVRLQWCCAPQTIKRSFSAYPDKCTSQWDFVSIAFGCIVLIIDEISHVSSHPSCMAHVKIRHAHLWTMHAHLWIVHAHLWIVHICWLWIVHSICESCMPVCESCMPVCESCMPILESCLPMLEWHTSLCQQFQSMASTTPQELNSCRVCMACTLQKVGSFNVFLFMFMYTYLVNSILVRAN